MDSTSIVSRVIELAEDVTACGPEAIEYDGLRVLQHPERLKLVLKGDGGGVTPVTIDLWPSLTCNARCPSCPYRLSGARSQADRSDNLMLLDIEQARQILAGAASMGARSVILTGGGDPLLHPEVVRIAQYARELGLHWALFTNGLALDAATASALFAECPSFLRVSLDAGSAEDHARIYGLKETAFDTIVANVIAAARIAQSMKVRSFGLGFTLEPTTSETQLRDIKGIIDRVQVDGCGGLALVAFRPRIVHYWRREPCVPQPYGGCFEALSQAIKDIVIDPLGHAAGNRVRLDLKQGLFTHAARGTIDPGCASSAWMTTIDQEGVGYATAELAGLRSTGQIWGVITHARNFRQHWFGPTRRHLHAQLEAGSIGVPLVHRTTPVDAFLLALKKVVEGPVEDSIVEAILQAVSSAQWYRSPNPDFV